MGSNLNLGPHAGIKAAARETLLQGEETLQNLDDRNYAETLESEFNSSIGAHYRHCLEHFQLLLKGAAEGLVDYDRRRRDPALENERLTAINATRALISRMDGLSEETLNSETLVVSKARYAGEESQTVRSSFGRELMYAVAHAVHHYALIRVMLRLRGLDCPEHFGVAPSTVAHERRMRERQAETEPAASPAP